MRASRSAPSSDGTADSKRPTPSVRNNKGERSRASDLPPRLTRSSRSVLPIISPRLLNPMLDSLRRTPSARSLQYLTTSSAVPAKRALRSGS